MFYIQSKKQISSSYRKVVNIKRKSEVGKLVLVFHDKCTKILGGCPATE